MKGVKKNVANTKGGKNSSLSSKLSEDMVSSSLYSKTKSRTLFHFTTVAIQATSVAKTSEVFWETSPTPR